MFILVDYDENAVECITTEDALVKALSKIISDMEVPIDPADGDLRVFEVVEVDKETVDALLFDYILVDEKGYFLFSDDYDTVEAFGEEAMEQFGMNLEGVKHYQIVGEREFQYKSVEVELIPSR